ncbi:unnamed protein product, partial [Prorocentrum cordatum]
ARASEAAARGALGAAELERRAGDLAAEAERQRRAALAAEEQASAARRAAEEEAQVARRLAAEAEAALRAAEEEARRVEAHREAEESAARQRAEDDLRTAAELEVLCTHLELHLPDHSYGAMLQVLKDHVAKGLAAEAEAQAAAAVSSEGSAEAAGEQAAAGAGGCDQKSLQVRRERFCKALLGAAEFQAPVAAAAPAAAETCRAAWAAEAAEGAAAVAAEGQQAAGLAAPAAAEGGGAAGAAGEAGEADEARERDVFAQIGATVIREKSDRWPADGAACGAAAAAAGQVAAADQVDSFADSAASRHQSLGRELAAKREALGGRRAELRAAEAAHAEAAARLGAAEEAARPDAKLKQDGLAKANSDMQGLMRDIDELKVLLSDFSGIKSEVSGKKTPGTVYSALDSRLKNAGVEQDLIHSLGLVLQRRRRMKGDMKVIDSVEEKLTSRGKTQGFLLANVKKEVARCEKAVADVASASELRAKELRGFADA